MVSHGVVVRCVVRWCRIVVLYSVLYGGVGWCCMVVVCGVL